MPDAVTRSRTVSMRSFGVGSLSPLHRHMQLDLADDRLVIEAGGIGGGAPIFTAGRPSNTENQLMRRRQPLQRSTCKVAQQKPTCDSNPLQGPRQCSGTADRSPALGSCGRTPPSAPSHPGRCSPACQRATDRSLAPRMLIALQLALLSHSSSYQVLCHSSPRSFKPLSCGRSPALPLWHSAFQVWRLPTCAAEQTPCCVWLTWPGRGADLGDGGPQVAVRADQLQVWLRSDGVQEPLQLLVADAEFAARQPRADVRVHLYSFLWPVSCCISYTAWR